MASLNSKKHKTLSCSSLKVLDSGAMNEQKQAKKGKGRKKLRSTLGLNNFVETAGEYSLVESAKKSKTTKKGEWLDILPSLEGYSSQSSRTCTSESDAQDGETSADRKLRRGRSKNAKKSRNLSKSQAMRSVSEESIKELDKENTSRSKKKAKRNKSIKPNLEINEEEDNIVEENQIVAAIKNTVIGGLRKISGLMSSSSVADSPASIKVIEDKVFASEDSQTPEDKEEIAVDNPRKNYVLKRNRSVATPVRKISSNAKLRVTPTPRKLNEEKVCTEEILEKLDDIEVNFNTMSCEAINNKIVDNLRQISILQNSARRNKSIIDSPRPKKSVVAKLSGTPVPKKSKNLRVNKDIGLTDVPEGSDEKEDTEMSTKNTTVGSLRKNSVLKNKSAVQSPKPRSSVVAKLSKTPAPKTSMKKSYVTPLKSTKKASRDSKRVTNESGRLSKSITSANESVKAPEPIKDSTFNISSNGILPLDDEELPDSFDFIEIGDKIPTRYSRPTPESKKTSLNSSKRDTSIISINDSSLSDKNVTFEKISLSDDVFEPDKKLKRESSLSDEVFYDSICHLSSGGKLIRGTSDEVFGKTPDKSKRGTFEKNGDVFYDSVCQPNLTEQEEDTWPSPKKLRSTFDKNEERDALSSETDEIVGKSLKKNLRSTFDKSLRGTLDSTPLGNDSICKQSTGKKSKKGTFDSIYLSEKNEIVHPSPKKTQRTSFGKNSSNDITQPSPKKKLRSTFDKIEITQPSTSLLDNEEITGPSPTKNPRRSTFDKLPTITFGLQEGSTSMTLGSTSKSRKNSNQPQSGDILDNLNITRRESGTTGNDDGSSKFVTLRRTHATTTLNQSTPLFGAKTQKLGLKAFEKPTLEKSAKKSPLPQKSAKKSILKKKSQKSQDLANFVASKDAFLGVFNMPADQLDNLMLDNEKPDLLIDTFANPMGISLKPQLISPEHRRSSRRRWSQSEKTPIFDKLPDKSSLTINKSVRFEGPQEEVQTATTKKSVKINSPLTTPKRNHSPMVIRKTPMAKFDPDILANTSIISGNCAQASTPVNYMSPPASSSTPRLQNKDKSLLKKVLTNEKNKAEKMVTKITSSRIKMPNFAKIHERRNEKLESIQDLVERKNQRAQYLMSGGKSLTTSKENTEKESKKKLFGDKDKETNILASKLPVLKVTKMKQKIIQKKRASLEKKQKELKSKSPAVKIIESKAVAPQMKKRLSLEKKKVADSGSRGEVISRYGFKVAANKVNITKEEQIKAVCTKSKFITNSSRTEQNRKNTAEVRTNRRFELLMQMRANKK